MTGFSILEEPLEKEIFPAFKAEWKEKTGQNVTFASTFNGSEMATNQILHGFKVDLAILAIERDAERLREGSATKSDWRKLPHHGIVNRTPFVILVRKGNPKRIHDFEDLARPGVKLIHPRPGFFRRRAMVAAGDLRFGVDEVAGEGANAMKPKLSICCAACGKT